MNHTPGPWKYWASEHEGFDEPTVQSEFGLIVSMPTPEDPEGIANAHLIASAPELLEALKGLLECSRCKNGCKPDDLTCASNVADQAIAKAEGKE